MQKRDDSPDVQRVRGAWRVRACAAAMAVGAQVFLSGAGVVIPLCLNAAWLASLASLPAAALTVLVCRRMHGRQRDMCSGAQARALHALLAAAFLLCAWFAVASMVSLAEHSLLPQTRATHSVMMTILSVFLCALGGSTGAPRLAFALRMVLSAGLAALCAAAFPLGELQGIFPLLGTGAESLVLGALCMAGAAFPAMMLLYPPPELEALDVPADALPVPEAGFFLRRMLLGAGTGTALLFSLLFGSTYETLAQKSSWGTRLLIVSSARPGEGIVQTGLTLLELLAALLLAVNMLLCARQAMERVFDGLSGLVGLVLGTAVLAGAAAALFFVGFDAALLAVPLLSVLLIGILAGIWMLGRRGDAHGT